MVENSTPPTPLVVRLYDDVMALSRAAASPQADAAMSALIEQLFTVTYRITQAPASTAAELDLKLAVLCRRLRDQLDLDDRGAVLTYLLAAAVRDDHEVLTDRSTADPNP